MTPTLQALIDSVNAEFAAKGLAPVTDEQIAVIESPMAAMEALDMVCDWSDRLGLSEPLYTDLDAYITDSFYIHQRG